MTYFLLKEMIKLCGSHGKIMDSFLNNVGALLDEPCLNPLCCQLMLELAKLYLNTEDLDACQHQCMTLLKNDKENDAATVVRAGMGNGLRDDVNIFYLHFFG